MAKHQYQKATYHLKHGKHEVEGLMKLYDTQVVIQSIRHSLRSPAAEVVWHLGMEASYEDIMDALETQYDDITETEAFAERVVLDYTRQKGICGRIWGMTPFNTI